MSTSLIFQVRESIKALEAEDANVLKEMEARKAEADRLIADAEGEQRNMDEKETARFNELRSALSGHKQRRDEIEEELGELRQRKADLDEYAQIRESVDAGAARWSADDKREENKPVESRGVRINKEPRTYSPDSERQGVSFFQDLYRRFRDGDTRASERLERHQREARLNELAGYEKRDGTTSNYAGLTVPQYLTDLAAPLARAMRPVVDICNRHPLPENGMTVNISRITTGTSVAAQSDQGDAVSETDADDTLLTINVRTYSGQQDLSRQALERSTGVDNIVTQDLVNAYWTTLDDAIINGAGTNGTHLGIVSTTNIETVAYADTSPTAAELYPKLAEIISDVQSGVFMGVTHFVMHPRRWWWLASQIGSSFPLLQAPMTSPQQAGNIGGTEYMAQNRNILGVPVIVDGNITTTDGGGTDEDVILAVTAPELHLWHDDGPLFIRAEQPDAGSLEVKFVVYSYSAFTAGRYPGAHGVISSTGLSTPTF